MVDLSFSLLELEYFLLVMVRVTCFVYAAPFFGTTNVPNRVKIALGVFVAVLIYNTLTPAALPYNSVFVYAIIIVKEAFTGLLIGFSANICLSILNFAGHIADMNIGLSMVSIFDPVTKDNVTISGTFYQYTVMLMLFISGLYQYVLAAIVESFSLIPVNGAIFNSEKLVTSMIAFFTDYVMLGFRIVLPVFAAILLLNAILGILAKISPQLNMFAVGIQLKILVGLGVLFLTVGVLPNASVMILSEVKKMITVFTEAML